MGFFVARLFRRVFMLFFRVIGCLAIPVDVYVIRLFPTQLGRSGVIISIFGDPVVIGLFLRTALHCDR